MNDKARLAAFKAFSRIAKGAYSNLISDFGEVKSIDRAFAESIALGTLERKVTLEWVLAKYVKSGTKKDILYLLMTGVYQILYMDRVPDSAACDETVTLAKSIFGQKSAGFVNAVLREICRSRDKLLSDIESSEGYIKYSANEELYRLLESQYGSDIENIFGAFFGKSNTVLRVNTLKSDAVSVANAIGGEVISDTTVICGEPQKALALIASGEFYIQGPASQKAVALLGAERGQTVIDVCACPGGKSLGAAIDMCNEGKVLSFDLHANKLPLIEKSAQTLGIDIIKTAKQDARVAKEELFGAADRVICDVPCSGSGVMGSKPEIKYKSPSDFCGLYTTQRAIIRTAAKYLKAGGVMVYSTCSINKLENEEIIKDFLLENGDYRLICEETCLPYGKEKEGFYMAKIKREF